MARADRPTEALRRDFQGAIDRYGRGCFEEAGALLRKVLRSMPKDAGALHLMGAVHLRTGRNRDAVTVLKRAAGIDRTNAEIHNNLATAYRRERRTIEAIESGERAIAVNPSFAAAHFGLGRAHEDLDDGSRAARCYEVALAASAGHAERSDERRVGKECRYRWFPYH